MPTAAMSVPIWSEPPSISLAPAKSTTTVAITPRNSIAGKKTDDSFCAWTLETRFASLRSPNSRWKARSRLKAWTTAIPATDSASCAVTAAIRVRTSANATCDAVWNHRVTTIAGRQHDQRDDAEAPVEQEEAADRREQRQRVDDERRQALVEHVRERVDVARQARDDPAGLLLREVAQRERGEVVEEVAAQLEHDPLPDPGQHQPGRRAEQPGRRPDGDVGDDVER